LTAAFSCRALSASVLRGRVEFHSDMDRFQVCAIADGETVAFIEFTSTTS